MTPTLEIKKIELVVSKVSLKTCFSEPLRSLLKFEENLIPKFENNIIVNSRISLRDYFKQYLKRLAPIVWILR